VREKWTCPECGRSFARPSQWHSCQVVGVEKHFERAGPGLRDLYESVLQVVASFGALEAVPTKTGITLLARTSFAGIKVRRDCLRLGFLLSRRLDDSRVFNIEVLSPRKIGHHVDLRSEADLDAQLRLWLEEAYAFGSRRAREG